MQPPHLRFFRSFYHYAEQSQVKLVGLARETFIASRMLRLVSRHDTLHPYPTGGDDGIYAVLIEEDLPNDV
jgi:hypothetical protein